MKLYLFGGAVRDFLLGVKPADYDFIVDTDQSIGEVKKELESRGFVVTKYKPRLRLLTARGVNGEKYDFAVKSPTQFSEYTVNNMYYRDGKLIDFVGGLQDIKTKTLRATSIYKLDGEAIVRGLRMMARYNFTADLTLDLFFYSNQALVKLQETEPKLIKKRLAKFTPQELELAQEICKSKYPLLHDFLF